MFLVFLLNSFIDITVQLTFRVNPSSREGLDNLIRRDGAS